MSFQTEEEEDKNLIIYTIIYTSSQYLLYSLEDVSKTILHV